MVAVSVFRLQRLLVHFCNRRFVSRTFSFYARNVITFEMLTRHLRKDVLLSAEVKSQAGSGNATSPILSILGVKHYRLEIATLTRTHF